MYDRLLNIFLKFFIITFVGIPASSLITLKAVLFIVLIYSFILWAFINKKIYIGWSFYVFSIVTFILGSAFFQTTIDGRYIEEGIRFISNAYVILILVLIYYIAMINRLLTFDEIKKSFYVGVILFLFIKFSIIYIILFGNIAEARILVSEIIYKDYGGLLRINLGNDSIILFSLLALLPFLKGIGIYFALIVLIFILLTSYTKYLLLSTLMSIFIFGILYNRKFGIVFLSILPLIVININDIIKIYVQRFFEYSSYEDKALQVKIFLSLVFKSINVFLFGEGLGSYIDWFIKNPRLPFIYEVQWLSLVYQLGILRFIIIVCMFLLFLYKIYRIDFKAKYLTLNFLLWLLASFTNPYLLITSSFIIYTIYIAIVYGYENIHPRYKGYSQ